MSFSLAEELIRIAVGWLRLGIETLGAVVIAVGLLMAIHQLVRKHAVPRQEGFASIRLTFARYLALALELQLAADILSTAIAPSWDSIGKLAATAVIRTALNYFLGLEMERERAASADSGKAQP